MPFDQNLVIASSNSLNLFRVPHRDQCLLYSKTVYVSKKNKYILGSFYRQGINRINAPFDAP